MSTPSENGKVPLEVVEPCHCAEYNRFCGRAGRRMNLRDWELCSGKCPPSRPCKPETSEAYRRKWDRSGNQNDLCRLGSLLLAVVRFVRGWFRIVSRKELVRRTNTCNTCDQLDRRAGTCKICGCLLGMKLRMKSEHCPIGKW